ncbi:HD-GYP domain-containing protein [Chromobacterium violaceum]|uniref:HD-GYP domain-containing protein n=1 Tax=Chromobacterium violaceum TaxID=536 RepID=UPI00143DF2C0|nr:HD domain-containing phosphohydrolase [Chromobacterium violaceum]MBP4047135.1 phosphohydrolase [Chromobacterium violaceum]MBX9268589.1 phosphohydrolase [Chromobacterium violaceum]QIY78138.1 phosphohydrolase [Chromobacterium violaceum]
MTVDSTKKQTKVSSSMLSIGKELPVDVYSKSGFLLLKRGHYVLTPEQKQKLVTLGFAEAKAEARAVEKPNINDSKKPSLFEDIAFLQQRVRSALHHALVTRNFEAKVMEIAQSLIQLAEKHPDALIASIFLVPFSEYSVAHSMHAAALLSILTRHIALPPSHRETLICAALTMNISQVELQNELFGQAARLDDGQRQAVLDHPIMSSAILREAGVEDQLWHTLVQTHHESWRGNGYPFGLAREQILPPAHLLHLADITCAKLLPRRYRSALLPATALGQIFQRKDKEFDQSFTTMLVRELGIYPPGSFVRLASEEICVVISAGAKPSEPLVAAIRRADGPPYGEPLLRDTSKPGLKVAAPCHAGEAKVRVSFLAHLWKC